MKILLDENVPNMYKEKLESYGYNDIKRINDFGKGLPDEKVFETAINEHRTIITIDTDFHKYKKAEHYGIISISGKVVSALKNPVEKIIEVLDQIEKDEIISKYKENAFIRITTEFFDVGFKKKGKYKELRRKYKKD